MTAAASALRASRGAGSRPDLREPIRLLARRYVAEPPHRARHVAGIGANQEPLVAQPGQADPTQPVPGFVDGDDFAGVCLPANSTGARMSGVEGAEPLVSLPVATGSKLA